MAVFMKPDAMEMLQKKQTKRALSYKRIRRPLLTYKLVIQERGTNPSSSPGTRHLLILFSFLARKMERLVIGPSTPFTKQQIHIPKWRSSGGMEISGTLWRQGRLRTASSGFSAKSSIGSSKKCQFEDRTEVGQAPWSTSSFEEDDDLKIEFLKGEIKTIFESLNDGETSPSAYDTAWVARISAIDNPNTPQFPTTLGWIFNNQHEDGSWGEPSFFLIYDRLICTLACVLTLNKWDVGHHLVAKGLKFLQSGVKNLEYGALNLRTCGFEMIFPSMLVEARNFGLDLPYNLPYFNEISVMRAHKIKLIPVEVIHSVHTTLLYSLEALEDVVNWEKILKLQSRDGSFLSSPSSTAFAYMKTGDKKCLDYLTFIVNRFGGHAPAQYPIDIFERAWLVDTIQRLGIAHHFQPEISNALDYLHRHLKEEGLSWGRDNPIPDVDDSSMALRLLRLHGYPISPDVLNNFKEKDGNFCFVGQTHLGLSDMFNLYRFSQVRFPGETIMTEAQAFAEGYLKSCLKQKHLHDKWSLKKAFHKEVEYSLKFPWKMNLQRLEVREYIHNYGKKDVWISKTLYLLSNVNNSKYLELAKSDYNLLLAIYQRERHDIHRWRKSFGFSDPFFERSSAAEIYSSIAATMHEAEFAACRMAYTKCNYVENIIQDLFMIHESVEDLRALSQAVAGWDPISVHHFPEQLKSAFWLMYNTLNEMATLATKAQARDMFPYLLNLRVRQVEAYMNHREEGDRKQVLTVLHEHLGNGKDEAGIGMRVLPAMFLLREHLPDNLLEKLDYRSKIHDRLSLFIKLLINTTGNVRDEYNGSTTLIFRSYMEEGKRSEQEVQDHSKMVDDAFDELTYEYLKPSQIPHSCRRLMFEHARITHFFFTSNPSMIQSEIDNFFTPV